MDRGQSNSSRGQNSCFASRVARFVVFFCTVMFDVCVKIASYTHVFVLNLNHVQNNNIVYNMFYLN